MDNNRGIKLSIIIPTLNRALYLNKVLESIRLQQTQTVFEVIVIDNGSSDQTKEVCEQHMSHINLHYLFDDEPGLLTGRHLGAKVAKGDILSFLDDDVELNPYYINNLIDEFKHKNIMLATGPALPKYESYPPAWSFYFWIDYGNSGKFCPWLSLLDLGEKKQEVDPNFVWGLNFVIRKSFLLDLGGFNPDTVPKEKQIFQGDGETGLTIKAGKKGHKAFYFPSLLVYHHVDSSRLTKAYFSKRAYFQGICNSFSAIREKELGKDGKKTAPISKLRTLRNKIHPYYRWIKNIKFTPKTKPAAIPLEIMEMRTALAQAEQDGYDFHQKAFNQNEKVRAWVLKENYWDYKLPSND